MTELEDIATSSRQEIIENDPRYGAPKKWIFLELKRIEKIWAEERGRAGAEKARQIAPIRKWYDKLSPDRKKYAKMIFAKIEMIGIDDAAAKNELYKNGIIAFESLWARENLNMLDEISIENFEGFLKLFRTQEDIEAAQYYQVVVGRIAIIEKLVTKVKEDAKEKILQEHIYRDLWLLNPHWEHATENPHLEERITTEFGKINAKLTREEKNGRVDIRYKESAGKHIIVELKRASLVIDSIKLLQQVKKYRTTLIKVLTEMQEPPVVEVVCIVGKPCSDWITETEKKKSEDTLRMQDVRVVTYDRLIKDAYDAYRKFLDKKGPVREIMGILQEIDALKGLPLGD